MKTLSITAAAVAGLLVLAIGWMVIGGDPLGGEPYVVVELNLDERPSTDIEPVVTRDGREPGSDGSAPTLPDGDRAPGPGSDSLEMPAQSPSGPQAGGEPTAPGADTVAAAQVDDLLEPSRYGPLPRVAADGRRPSQIYARPSPHSGARQVGEPARIAILVNGLGLSEIATDQAINMLPGSVTLGYSPYGRNLQGWVRLSREAGHEVMLQIPLEPENYPDNDPGPHTLLTNLPPEENLKRLQWLMSRFTGYTGVTNLMGAKFAAEKTAVVQVLEEMKARGLIFLDDGTATSSGAGDVARELELDFSVAQVVIDPTRTPDTVDEALAKLEALALENGLAIGVANSLPVTIRRISEWSRSLSNKGLVLVPVSAAVGANKPS